MFITNERNNPSISRLNFGAVLTNTPIGVNLGSFGVLEAPRDISIYKDCDKVYGIVVNENRNDLIRLSFANGVESPISGKSLGNIGNFFSRMAFQNHLGLVAMYIHSLPMFPGIIFLY